jgi:hypothetical protein
MVRYVRKHGSQRKSRTEAPGPRPRGFFVGRWGSVFGRLGSASPSGIRCSRDDNANLIADTIANTVADRHEPKLTMAGDMC